MDIIRQIEREHMKPELPQFNVGDTVDVHYRIREGDKDRIQVFSGTVIARKGVGIRRSVLVRRLVAGEGVERLFPLHSPRVADIVVTRRGKVRRAKLYYLRDRQGKASRLREIFGDAKSDASKGEGVKSDAETGRSAGAGASEAKASGEKKAKPVAAKS